MPLPIAYQAALDYIFNYVDYERRRSVPYTEAAWDLDRTRRVLAALGSPHANLRFVHVAGSKGKGSTAAMIEAVLRAHGMRTGLYTSPHLHTFRERIRVDGQLLDRNDLVRLLEQSRSAIEAVPGMTAFEIITALALLHFAQREVAWAVLEVGLGGRLDATNVVTPAVSVIAPISLEHTALLGNDLDSIAREKAGIVKPGVPVICAPQEPVALEAIEAVARRQGAPLVLLGRDWQWHSTYDSLNGQRFDVCRSGIPAPGQLARASCELSDLAIPLLGGHQLVNATVAAAAIQTLADQGMRFSEVALRRGLAGVVWPARLEVLPGGLQDEPAVVVDSAHNETSAGLLVTSLDAYFPARSFWLVLGVSSDKDVDALLRRFAPLFGRIICTRSRHPRALPGPELARIAQGVFGPTVVTTASSVAAALAQALREAPKEAVVCFAGSLFVAAEAREAWLACHPGAFPPGDWAYEAEPPDPSWQVPQSRQGSSFLTPVGP